MVSVAYDFEFCAVEKTINVALFTECKSEFQSEKF